MDREKARAIVDRLGQIALATQAETKAPIVIVICMGALTEGSVLSSCIGAHGPVEMATALRHAADFTDAPDAEHIHYGVRPTS